MLYKQLNITLALLLKQVIISKIQSYDPQLYNRLLQLPEQYRNNPHSFLERFFEDYNLDELHKLQAEILTTCLTTDEPPFGSASNRARLILLHQNLGLLLEAVYIIIGQKESIAMGQK